MLKEKFSSTNRNALDELFDRHYQSQLKSHVASSYWEKYGAFVSVRKTNGKFLMEGCAFGHFVRPGTLRHCKHFIASILSRQLLDRFKVTEEIKVAGYSVARRQARLVIFDEVKQMIICDILNKQNILKQCKNIVVIGDGYGFMTCLLKILVPQANIICVNLGKILLFDLLFASKVFPNEKMVLLKSNDDYDKTLEQYSMVFIEAENCEMLFKRDLDLFINIASMQEMNPNVIKVYFDIIRSSIGKRYFYACNREEKVLPDGTIVRFDEYPWSIKDKIIFEEFPTFYQRFPVSTPPFWLSLDGPVKHKLAIMGQE